MVVALVSATSMGSSAANSEMAGWAGRIGVALVAGGDDLLPGGPAVVLKTPSREAVWLRPTGGSAWRREAPSCGSRNVC